METAAHESPKRERAWGPRPAAKEAGEDGDAVRGVLAGDREAEYRRVRAGPCEREEAEEERDERGGPDGVDGRLRARVHAVDGAREGEGFVPREGEDLARGGCELGWGEVGERRWVRGEEVGRTMLEPIRNLLCGRGT